MTTEATRNVMRANRGTDTGPERMLRSELHRRGLRFRKHDRICGARPDVVFYPARVAVFVDGEFWHGRDYDALYKNIKTRRGYWLPKIARNRRRDVEQNARLRAAGWTVIRIWETEIRNDVGACAARVERAVRHV